LAVLVQQRPVKGEIDLQDRDVFEILLDAVDREDFFDKGFSGNDFGPFGGSVFVPVLRINLAEPAGVAVAGRADEDLGMEIAKFEIIDNAYCLSSENVMPEVFTQA
jgi:hypothetical protein